MFFIWCLFTHRNEELAVSQKILLLMLLKTTLLGPITWDSKSAYTVVVSEYSTCVRVLYQIPNTKLYIFMLVIYSVQLQTMRNFAPLDVHCSCDLHSLGGDDPVSSRIIRRAHEAMPYHAMRWGESLSVDYLICPLVAIGCGVHWWTDNIPEQQQWLQILTYIVWVLFIHLYMQELLLCTSWLQHSLFCINRCVLWDGWNWSLHC